LFKSSQLHFKFAKILLQLLTHSRVFAAKAALCRNILSSFIVDDDSLVW